jgi:hypothetical protein
MLLLARGGEGRGPLMRSLNEHLSRDLMKTERKTLKKNRWFYFVVCPRDLEPQETVYKFVAKVIAENEETDEMVLQTQDGELCYLHIIDEIKLEDDAVQIHAEWVEVEDTVEEVVGWLKDTNPEIDPPKILTELKV